MILKSPTTSPDLAEPQSERYVADRVRMTNASLPQTIARFRQRMLWIGGISGLGWSVVALVVAMALAVWLDLLLELSPWLRIAAVICIGLAVVGSLARAIAIALRQGVPAKIARHLDSVSRSGGLVLSAFDLLEARSSHVLAGSPAVSSGLAAMAVHRAANFAANVPAHRAVPTTGIRRPFRWLAIVLCGAAVPVLVMPGLARTEWLRFSEPFGDHPPYSRVRLLVEPAGAQVVYGGGLQIQVTAQGTLSGDVELVLLNPSASPPEEVLPMFAEPGGGWRASIASLIEPQEYFVRAGSARSHRYPIDIITVPRVELVRFKITPPAYTQLATTDGELPEVSPTGLAGTNVQVWVRSNRPLAQGRMVYVFGKQQRDLQLKPNPELATEVSGTFQIEATGRIELSVVDSAGQSSQEVTAPITLLTDERPLVRLLQPQAISFATPSATIPVVVSAEDDYGIARLQLFRSLNDSRYLAMDFSVSELPKTRLHQGVDLPLAAYGLEPGDEIKLFARVEDNDPGASIDGKAAGTVGKGAESSVAVLRIISEEEFQRMRRTRDAQQTLASKYREAQRRIESLANEAEGLRKKLRDLPADSALAAETRNELQRLTKRMEEEAAAIRRLSKDLLPYDLDHELTDELDKLASALEQLAKASQALASDNEATSSKALAKLDELMKELENHRQQFADAVNPPLELLEAVFPLKQDEARFVELYRRQRDLAERLAALKDRDGEDNPSLKARMRDLEAEQLQLRSDLQQLLEDIDDHVARLPPQPEFDQLRNGATAFAQAVRSSGASEAMADAATGLVEFSGSRGHKSAKLAADILETFLSDCEGMGDAAGQCLGFQPGMSAALAATIGQMLADGGLNGGTGTGAGGGYSVRRSSLQNVGMYGVSPQYGETGDGSTRSAQGGAGSGGSFLSDRTSDEATFGADNQFQAAGGADAVVPLRYRKKVGEYFRRIADETGRD